MGRSAFMREIFAVETAPTGLFCYLADNRLDFSTGFYVSYCYFI
jgi:hypothetical protein